MDCTVEARTQGVQGLYQGVVKGTWFKRGQEVWDNKVSSGDVFNRYRTCVLGAFFRILTVT